jgi:hypothetical protein
MAVRHPTVLLLGALLVIGLLPCQVLPETNETQARNVLNQLKRFRPGSEDAQRQAALLDIDALFMNDSLASLAPIVKDLISTALSEISASGSSGTSVWYFWNMGYVAKVGGQVIGFDIAELELAPLNEDQKEILAKSLDILLISHVDTPHVDRDLVSLMREDAIVVCPAEEVEYFDYITDRKSKVIGMEAGTSRQVGSVQVEALYGDHGEGGAHMRSYLVSVGGVRLLQTGDQRTVADWMKDVGRKGVDVLMINPLWEFPWTVEAIQTIDPVLALPGTMYDMSHPKDTWRGYPYAYQLREEVGPAVVPVFFGEKLSIAAAGGGGTFPTALVVTAAILVSLPVAFVAMRRGRAKRPMRPRAAHVPPECERRYVEKLCLACKDFVIKGGHPYCTRHKLKLRSDR